MNTFEEQLRAALQRKDPPEGFADRVLLRVQRKRRWGSQPPRRWLAAAALLFITSGSLFYWRREQRIQAEGERARAELVQALQISSEKLNLALKRLNHVNENKEKS
jgi:hypothetical protein